MKDCFSFGAVHHVAVAGESPDAETILKEIRAAGFKDCEAREILPDIEDCFMQLASGNRQS